MSDMIRVTGLWKNRGEGYSGSLSYCTRAVILKNRHKQKDGDPDLYLFIAPKEKDDAPQTNSDRGIEDEGDDIPF